jgi:DNA-binding XRE family transcriptional regulator
MNFDPLKFRAVYERSGLTKNEIAEIAGTTRQTVYNWHRGHPPKQQVLAERAAAATTVIFALMTAQRPVLPFPESLSAPTRVQKIKAIIAKVVSLKSN